MNEQIAPGASARLPVTSGEKGKFAIDPEGMVQLFPFGEYPGRLVGDKEAKQFIQVLDAEAAAAMVAGFSFDKDLCIDYEHRKLSSDRNSDTSAGGWIDGLEARADGLYGHVRWTAKGLSDIEGGVYRFLSPEVKGWTDLGGGRMRPSQLSGASLTNIPNISTINPVANKAPANPKINMDYKAKLLAILGLAATATDDEITAALDASAQKKQADTAAVAANKAELEILRGELADSELARRGIKPDSKAHAPLRKAIVANRADGIALADAIAVPTSPAARDIMGNRQPASDPASVAISDDAGLIAANKAEAEVRAYMRVNKTSYDDAFNAVRGLKPELFAAPTK